MTQGLITETKKWASLIQPSKQLHTDMLDAYCNHMRLEQKTKRIVIVILEYKYMTGQELLM